MLTAQNLSLIRTAKKGKGKTKLAEEKVKGLESQIGHWRSKAEEADGIRQVLEKSCQIR